MLTALMSDIHGNREAFEACLDDARGRGVERFIFLGDYVGYGADPSFVVDTVSRQVADGAVALLGNHDEAISGSAERMTSAARVAIEWTRGRLDNAQRVFLRERPLVHEEADRLFVHANAYAPANWAYVTDRLEAARSLAATRQRSVFCGHLHVPGLYPMQPNGLIGEFTPVRAAVTALAPPQRWLVRLGAVGQPRDGDPDAAYALLDDERNELTLVRVPYDVDAAARKIITAGLPERLAVRLYHGR
jgi:diadenosine tetraphosphatase ApaH/serine/threonine PP2A family protein phosphatase